MLYNNIELSLLIKGRPVTEYPSNGQIYIEGREGSAYEVQVRNRNSFRVEAVVSVDGLSVIDGKDAGPASTGYLLEAGETVTIPGWKLSDTQVAAFEFAGKGKSYAAQSTGSARNTGVIGVMAFQEKHTYRTLSHMQPLRSLNINHMVGRGPVGGGDWNSTYTSASGLSDYTGLIGGANASTMNLGGGGLESFGTASFNSTSGDWLQQQGMVQSSFVSDSSPALASVGTRSRGITKSAAPKAAAVEQTLGTQFGKAQDFATTTVAFERGDLQAMIILYYDDAKGLRSRGIDLSRRSRKQTNQNPVAFPGMTGCTPPPGWRG